MEILFLGGTSFVGRHIAEAALARGHEITFFNRGRTDASLFPEQRHLRGDRDGDVSALAAVRADAVIDTSGYAPDAVEASARAVAPHIRRYLFVSSIDRYDFATPEIDESSPAKPLPPGASTARADPELYGAHKAACEDRLRALLGEPRVVSLRAGLVFGPYDATDRSTYWPARLSYGGEVLVPEPRSSPVQYVDARDLATFAIDLLDADRHGAFNVVCEPGSVDFGDVLDASAAASAGSPSRPEPEYVWAPSDFLAASGVGQWVELPLWLHDDLGPGLRNVRPDRARAAGLRLRPLAETCRDILAEYRARDERRTLRAGLTPDRERGLIRALRARA